MAVPSIKAPSEQDSVPQLVGRLSADVGRIVRAELALLQARLSAALRAVRSASVLLVVGVVLALGGVGALVTALILGVMVWLTPWLAGLVVGVGLLAVAGLLIGFQVRIVAASVSEALASEEQLVREEARYGH